jgi:hypothetical protein
VQATRRSYGGRTILGTAIVLVVILTICASLRPAATPPKLSVGIGSLCELFQSVALTVAGHHRYELTPFTFSPGCGSGTGLCLPRPPTCS